MVNSLLSTSYLGLSQRYRPLTFWNLILVENRKVGEQLSARILCASLIIHSGDEYKSLIGVSIVKGFSLLLYYKRTSVFGPHPVF